MSMIFNGGSGHLSSCPGCHLLVNKSEEELGAEIQWCVSPPSPMLCMLTPFEPRMSDVVPKDQ